jgi:hypothetical protein
MGERRADADHRRFLDQYEKIRICRFRATGVVDPSRNYAIIPLDPAGTSAVVDTKPLALCAVLCADALPESPAPKLVLPAPAMAVDEVDTFPWPLDVAVLVAVALPPTPPPKSPKPPPPPVAFADDDAPPAPCCWRLHRRPRRRPPAQS